MKKAIRLIAVIAILGFTGGAVSAQTLTITDSNYGNGVFSGTYVGTNSQPAITIATSKPVTIINSVVSGPGDLIYSYYASNPNITIMNTLGTGTYPGGTGQYKGRFVKIDGPEGVTIEHCTLESTGGIYLDDYKGDTSANQTIRIRYNKVHNIDGRKTDGNGGYRNGNTNNDFFRAQFVQLNHIGNNGPVNGIEIAWNEVVNDPYNSRVEDNINIGGGGSGTSGSPMQIHDNYIQGAYPALPGAQYQQTFSGGGILLSDGGGGGASWVQAHDNIVVGTTNYGVQINGGSNCAYWNNRIVASGFLPSGEKIWAMNRGGILDQGNNNIAHQPGNVNVGNVIGWVWPAGTINNGGSTGARGDAYFPENPDDYNHQTWWTPNDGAHPTISDEANEYNGWTQRLNNNNVFVGALSGYIVVRNRWTNNLINTDSGFTCSNVGTNYWDAQWAFEMTTDGYYKLRNREQGPAGPTNSYINTENGFQCTGIVSDWWSAQWSIERTSDGYFRLKNRWQGTYINTESGFQCTNIQPGWWSAMWSFQAGS
ncbi:hypothetical protein CCAX7_45360 [Capsulimonas corticalis]|uniref:Uncharacterized protein n=1 Tax=Capsulimonas corticalis TaxID=2219043 RepID=A0A402D627_9BACT|nr:RICIN domain-containing protein [Capsulimonas corticalis]BDI32485.1 hypothetical protein CCAX7_45360 [Capsulimonas corticalis]